ncbi:MAG: hypothetical protein ACI837_000145 [Crocinitomicaceae bacterium]
MRQVDFNGSVTTSNIIAVSDESITEISLFPNPAKDQVYITSSDPFSTITLTDIRGNMVEKVAFLSKKLAFPCGYLIRMNFKLAGRFLDGHSPLQSFKDNFFLEFWTKLSSR